MKQEGPHLYKKCIQKHNIPLKIIEKEDHDATNEE